MYSEGLHTAFRVTYLTRLPMQASKLKEYYSDMIEPLLDQRTPNRQPPFLRYCYA